MGRKRIFTDSDIKFILKNYERLSYEKLGEVLGQNPHSIRAVYSRGKAHAQEVEENKDEETYCECDPKVFMALMIASMANHRKYAEQTAFII